MASLCSSNEKHNFNCVIIACVDFIKLPLKDILASRIKPVNLYKEIDSCPSLKLNGQCCLRSDQRKVCFIQPPDLPNYADFDASLLYKLIRNLCPSLKPTQGWGKEPNPTDTDIGDDIERLRLFRNIYFAHASSAAISDTAFKDLWKNLKSVTGRFQLRMGHCGNYEEELIKIERTKFTHDHLQHYKLLLEAFVRLSPEDEDEPDILIKGEEEVTCGDSASFEAEIKPENIGDWLITWRKRIGNDIKCIDTSMEKYRGSSTRKLVIQSVCKEDQGEYRAILSRSSNGNEYRQSKNTICLRVLGDLPLIKDLQVTTGKHCINLLCSYEVLGRSPKVSRIAWSKNGEILDERVISFAESIISESCYKITSPSNEDKGKYSCTITNAVGSVSEEITLDVPSVEIETDPKVCFGSKTTFRSKVSSIPSPKKVEWQTSKDETDYHCIDIEDPKYYGSNATPECPLLVIPKTTFDDKLYYRLVVLNKIGGGISNTVKINVTGNLPNISTIQETNIKNKFVKLIGNIFLDDDSPGLLEVFWTKNGKKIDIKGSGGRLSEVTIDDPSLIIKEVCHHDAGPYQLTATNAVGPTKSDEIVLDAPDVSFDKINKEDGSQWFVATIQSIPAPCFVQWSLKSMNDDMFTPIDVNSEDYKGTLNTLPHPVLVVKNSNQFEINSYQIEVANFVGSTIKNIDDQTPQIQNDKGTQTGIETGVMENPLYREPGPGIKFSKLSDYLAENFPREKLKRLKNLLQASGKVQNMTNLQLANSALECFTILQDEMLFSPNDVIFMQFLCKEMGCKKLYTRCIKYASNNKALCFFERPVENGCTNVQFHIQGDLTAYTKEQIKHIVEVVADILDCDIEEILVNGVRPSASFFLVLSVKEAYIWKLKHMNEHNHIRLMKLNIDFIIVDKTTIKLKRQKEAGKVWEFSGIMGGYQRVKPGFSEIFGENIEVDLDPAGNPVKAKWNFSNSCGLAFSSSPLGDNRKYEIIFSGSGHARIGLTQNDPDHIRDIQEAVRKNQILFVSDVRYHKRQCVVDIMKKDGIGGSKFVTKYKDDNPQIKDLLSSNDVWAVIYLKFGNITAEIKDKDSGASLKFHKKRDRNIKPTDLMISLRSSIPFAYACAEKGISRGQGIRVRVEHIKNMEKKPNSFHLGIGISDKKLMSGSSLDIAPFLFKKLEKDECLGEFFVCISKKGKFHLCRGDLCIYSKALPTEMNLELPMYVCFEIFRVQIELMDTSYCEHSEAVENPGEEPKPTENIPPETTDPSYVIFEMFNAIRIVDEDIKSRKMTPEVRKFSDDLTEYVKHISLDRSNAEYLTPISTRLAEGEGKSTLTINDLLKKLEGIEKTIVEQHLERQQDYMKILEAIKVNREKIAEKRVDSGVFTNHLQNTCADFIANVDAFPLCDHLLQIGIFHQIQFETILDEHKLSRQDANRSLFRILVKKEYTPEQLRSIWKAFSVTKQDSLLPKLDPS